MVCLSRSVYYYQAKRSDDKQVIDVLDELTQKYQRWGFPKCFNRIRKLGYQWNHKRVYRIYKLLKLNLKRKSKKRLPSRNPDPLIVPSRQGDCWSMDFVSHSLYNKVRFRTFNVIDDFNRELLGIDIATSIPALKVIRFLDKLADYHGYPKKIRVDNGSEFTSDTFDKWAKAHDIVIDYIDPGCPYQNAYIERYNRSYCHEVLDLYLFNDLHEVKKLTEDWMIIYNNERPHEALNNMTPNEYRNTYKLYE